MYLPLRTNHWLKDDEEWGKLLSDFTNEGPTEDEIDFINSRLTTDSSNIPGDVTYAIFRSIYCCAINEAILRNVLRQNCSNSVHDEPPNNIICIMSDITELRNNGQ